MKTRNITVTLEKAKEWYNIGMLITEAKYGDLEDFVIIKE